MKILFVNATSEIGGADLSLMDLIGGLDRKTFKTVVILPHRGPYSDELERLARVHYIPLRKLKKTWNLLHHIRYLLAFPLTLIRLIAVIRRERPDIVHVNASILLSAGLAARLCGRPLVWHVRELGLRPRWAAAVVRQAVLTLADRILFISEAVAAEFPSSPKEEIIYNGVPIESLPRVPGRNRILAVARLVPFKGIDRVVEVVQRLTSEFPDLTLTVVGSMAAGHEHYAAALRRSSEQALGSRLRWMENIRDVRPFWAGSDVFVHLPRDPEPLGRTALEAGAAGLPSVVARSGGLPEIVEDGETGFVVPSGDTEAAAERIGRLLRDPALAARMGKAASRWVAERFNETKALQRITAVYEDIFRK